MNYRKLNKVWFLGKIRQRWYISPDTLDSLIQSGRIIFAPFPIGHPANLSLFRCVKSGIVFCKYSTNVWVEFSHPVLSSPSPAPPAERVYLPDLKLPYAHPDLPGILSRLSANFSWLSANFLK